MRYVYYVVTRHKNGKYLSFVDKVSDNCGEIYHRLKNIPDIENASVFTSKKKAEEICNFWNETYKKNGTYWGC